MQENFGCLHVSLHLLREVVVPISRSGLRFLAIPTVASPSELPEPEVLSFGAWPSQLQAVPAE